MQDSTRQGNEITPEARAVGREIASARVRRSWTQKDLARESGFDQSTIAKWELGRRSPKVEDLIRLSRALGTTAGAILDAAADAVEKDAGPDA